MTAASIEDPSERELLLVRDASVLAFGPRAFEASAEELIKWIGLDLAAGVPIEMGAIDESYTTRKGDVRYAARYYQLGTALAVVTDVEEAQASHRVLEVLGVKGDVRVRFNITRSRSRKLATVGGAPGAREEAEPLGNVRVWGGEPGEAERAVASIHRHLRLLGLDPQAKGGTEPRFEPPAADRYACDLPSTDGPVTASLIELLLARAIEGARVRPPRRLSLLEDRAKRADGNSIAYRFEAHRAGSGILHVRRREVEAGPGRPGLVRTWNVVGLRGGARLRLRDVAGRAVAEVGGSREGVAALTEFLEKRFAARS